MFSVLAASGGETAVDMAEVVTDGLTSVGSQMTGVVSSVVPIALGIVGAVLVVRFGIRIFKSITGR